MADQNTQPNFDDLFDDEIVVKDATGQKKTVKSSQLSEVLKEEINQKKQQQKEDNKQLNQLMLEAMQRILDQSQVDFQDDEMMLVRFKNIILARLKQLRDKKATHEALMKPRLQGGLTLVEEKAKSVSDLIEKEFKQINDQEESLKEVAVEKPKEKDLQVTKPKKKLAPPPPAAKKRMDQLKQELQKPQPIPKKEEKKPEELKAKPQEKKEEKPESPKPQPEKKRVQVSQPETPKISRPQVVDSGKPRIEDVKYPNKLTGPLDELRRLSLVDFRRLASNPEDATSKISGKFALLEDESFEKRMDGIVAYFGSPLFTEYIQLGIESLENKVPLNQLYAKPNEDGLTENEFLALNSFHSSLM